MIKVKDGYAKLIGTTYSGSVSRVLLSNGGDHVLGNASSNIPLNNGTVNTNLNADMLDGLHIHAGRNNEANKIVRTDASGYILAGWINTTSGNIGTGAINKIYCSNDDYIRYKTPANFFETLANDGNQISITIGSQNRKLTVNYASFTKTLDKVSLPSSTSNAANTAWCKFARITFNNSAWSVASGYLFFGGGENPDNRAILVYHFRSGNTATTLFTANLYWLVKSYSNATVIAVKAADNVYDLYTNNSGTYLSPCIYHMSAFSSKFTWSIGNWTTTKPTAAYTSSDIGIVNYANSASNADTSNRTKFLETFKQGSTTDTYGSSYPIWAQWLNSTNVRLKCTNYTVWTDKADYASSAGNADTVDGLHLYTRNLGINGSSWTFASTANANATTHIYAATSAGTSGQILKSTGGTPTWMNQSDLTAGKVTCTVGTSNIFRPIVLTNESNQLYYSTKIKGNYSTGKIQLSGIEIEDAAGNIPLIRFGSANKNSILWKVYSNDTTYANQGVYGFDMTYFGTGSGNANRLVLHADNQNSATKVEAISITQDGIVTFSKTISGSINGNADTVDGQHFNWNNNKNDHTYLWAATDNGNAYLVRRASISVNYANSSGYANYLNSVSRMDYGWNGINYFNASLTAGCTAKVNDSPTSTWWHILRFNHADNNGYYTDLAVPFSNNSLYWKTVRKGSVAYDHWIKVLDSLNYNEYAPTKTGGGASGTWGINITGNAATATNADKVDGYHASAFALVGHTHNYDNIYSKLGHTHDDRYYTESEINSKLGAYLPLSGGTMTGVIKSTYTSGSWIGGVTNAILKGEYTGYGAILSMPVKDGRISLSSYPANDNNIYFGYATTAQINAGTNSFNKQMFWDAANNNLHAGVFTGYLSGNASTASKWITARTLTIGNTGKTVDGSGNVSWSLAEIGAATSGHTHTLSLASDTGTSSITLAHGGKYKLTAGGNSVIFTLPTDNNTNPANYYWANIKVSAASSTSTAPQFSKVKINTTSSTYQLNVSGDSYVTGWSRAAKGFYCHDTGVHFTHNGTKGQIAITSNNEFCWGASNNTLYFNYSAPSLGTTVTKYIWNAGSSSTYASHTTGDIILGKSNYLITRLGCVSDWYNGRNNAMIRITSASPHSAITSIKTHSGSWEMGNGNLINDYLYFSYVSDSAFNNADYNFVPPLVYFDSSASVYATHFYEHSDIRYKKILRNLSINSNTIATLPLFDFKWIENNIIGTGTSALAVLLILPNLVSGTDKLTLDYGVLGTIAGITACKELVTLKSELLQLKEKVKELEDKLRKYENI